MNPENLPEIPIQPALAILLSVLIIGVAAGAIALIRNRRALAAQEEDEDTDLGVIFENPQSVVPHLIELRQRVINSLVGVLVAGLVAAALYQPLLRVLAAPALGPDESLDDAFIIIGVTEPVQIWFRVAITFGIILALPYVISQAWIFIAAGLKPAERRVMYTLFPFAVFLFATGVAFAYFIMLPVAVAFLLSFIFEAKPALDSYVSFVTTVLLFVGLSFEMPLVVLILARLGVVDSSMLIKNWRIALVLIAVLAALITPTPDPVNMGIVAAPLIILYILSIILARFAGKRRDAAEA